MILQIKLYIFKIYLYKPDDIWIYFTEIYTKLKIIFDLLKKKLRMNGRLMRKNCLQTTKNI